MFNQQFHQFSGQRKRTSFGVLNVPLPGVFTILLRGNINRHTSEIDIAPRGVQQFPTSHPGAQSHTNEQFPFDRRAFLLVLPGKPAQTVALLVCVYANLPSWRFRRLEIAKRVPVELSTIFRQLEDPFQLLDFFRSRARREILCQTILNESLTVLVANVLHIDISHARCKISHGPRPVLEGRGSNLSLRAYETILKEVC